MKPNKTEIVRYIGLSLLSPLLSLISLIRSANSKVIVPAGTFLMAILGSLYIYIPGNDGHTHLMTVEESYLNMDFSSFASILLDLFVLDNSNAPSGITDPYLHILGFLSGGVFGLPELLHVFASVVYGVIYFSIIKIVFQRISFPKGMSLILILFSVFFIYRGVTGLNAIRWWSAFWFLFYGILAYWNYNKKKYLILVFISIYIHFSFIVFVIPVISAIWLYKKPKIIMLIWIISFFVGASYDLIKPYIPELKVIEQKERYTLNEEQLQHKAEANSEQSGEGQRFYKALGEPVFRDFSIPLLIGLLFFFRKRFFYESGVIGLQLFTAGILLYSLGNLMEFSPSVHGRALAGSAPFIMASTLVGLSIAHSNNNNFYRSNKLRILLNIFLLSSIPVVMYHLSYFINILSAFTIIFPIASWILGSNDFSMRDLVVGFIK